MMFNSDIGPDTYLYVITAGDAFQKVGVATSPENRLSCLQSGCPLKLKLHYVSEIKFVRRKALDMEKIAHSALEIHRLRGEWFGTDPETATKITDGARVLYHECGCTFDECVWRLSAFA